MATWTVLDHLVALLNTYPHYILTCNQSHAQVSLYNVITREICTGKFNWTESRPGSVHAVSKAEPTHQRRCQSRHKTLWRCPRWNWSPNPSNWSFREWLAHLSPWFVLVWLVATSNLRRHSSNLTTLLLPTFRYEHRTTRKKGEMIREQRREVTVWLWFLTSACPLQMAKPSEAMSHDHDEPWWWGPSSSSSTQVQQDSE